VEHIPVYVCDDTAHPAAQSATSVVPISHAVIVPSPLQTVEEPEHGGKQDGHHDGGVGAASSAHVRASSICWQEGEITRAPNTPWHIGSDIPHADAFEQNWDEKPVLEPPLSLLHAAMSAARTKQGPRGFISRRRKHCGISQSSEGPRWPVSQSGRRCIKS
jgi:hypothetical protein